MITGVTGIVLSGGASSRMGSNKALITVGGKPVIERVLEIHQSLFEEVLLIANDPEPYLGLGVPIHPDLVPGKGALCGIATGLSRATNDLVFATACDMPFLSPSLIAHLVDRATGQDAVVPLGREEPEPLHAVYRKSCLDPMRRAIASGYPNITQCLENLEVELVTLGEVKQIDPELRSLFNVNKPEDLDRAEALWGHHT